MIFREGCVRESRAAYRLRGPPDSESSQEAARRAEISAAEEAHRNASGQPYHTGLSRSLEWSKLSTIARKEGHKSAAAKLYIR